MLSELSPETKIAIVRFKREFESTQWLSRTAIDEIIASGHTLVESYSDACDLYYGERTSSAFLPQIVWKYYQQFTLNGEADRIDHIVRLSSALEGNPYPFDMLADIKNCVCGCLAEIILGIPESERKCFEVWHWFHKGHWACGQDDTQITAIY
jgi:hypothetical protein